MKNTAFILTISLGVACLVGCGKKAETPPPSKPVASQTSSVTQAPAAQTPAGTNVFRGEKERVSYAIGMSYGRIYRARGIEVDYDMLVRGIKDQLAGGPMLLTDRQVRDTITGYEKELYYKHEKVVDAIVATNAAAGEAFLATNKNNPGVIALADGLQYKVITEGAGPYPGSNDMVTVNYRGTLLDGTEFADSFKRSAPARLHINGTIPGWTEALRKMKVGSKWQLFVPGNLAYGRQGTSGIQPGSLLIYELELLSTEPAPPPGVRAVPQLTSDIIKVPSAEEMKKGAKIEVIKPEDAAKLQQPSTNQPAQ